MRTSTLVVVVSATVLAACGTGVAVEPESPQTSQPSVMQDRGRALASCPARAPDALRDSGDESVEVLEQREQLLDPALKVAQTYLRGLPEDQRAGLWLDLGNTRVVLQVTYDADRVLSDLMREVRNSSLVYVERVRYSEAQLKNFAITIEEMWDELGLSMLGHGNANNRIEVGVVGDADEAWSRIASVVDPCAFRVEGGMRIVPL